MSGKTTITRVLAWDAAHRVTQHESKCRNLHGHRYVAEVEVEAEELDAVDRVIDFGRVKDLVGGWIDREWDHNLILSSRDDELIRFAHEQHARGIWPKAPSIVDGEPTAERLADHLYFVAGELLRTERTGLRVTRVLVYETPNCRAEVIR